MDITRGRIYKEDEMPTMIKVGIIATFALALPAVAAPIADKNAAAAVLQAQAEVLTQEQALARCLAASPTKNTPCIKNTSRLLARLIDRHISQIQAALNGSERACVRAAARSAVKAFRLERSAAEALNANRRTQAQSLFIQADRISQAARRAEIPCFAALGAGG
jgi:hypothetical protein